MENQELNKLVELAAGGDKAAFESLYKEKAQSILYRAVQITGNYQDGEDVAQEVVIKMYHNIGKLKNPKLFGSWLHSIIVNECKDMFRKKYAKKQPVTVTEEYSSYMVEDRMEFLPQEYVENEEKQQELMDIIHSLPEKQQNVLLLFYYENMSCAEIASLNKTSVSTVTSNLTKAKRSILKRVEKQQAAGVKMLGIMPVLQAVYQSNAQQVVSESRLSDFYQNIGPVLETMAQGSMAVTAGAATAAVSIKALIGVAAGVVIITGSLVAHNTIATRPNIFSPQSGDASVPQMEAAPIMGESKTVQLAGRVRFKDSKGNVIDLDGFSLGGLTVVLEDQYGQKLSSLTTDASGNYDFGMVELDSGKKYVLRLQVPGGELLEDVSPVQYFAPGEESGALFLSLTQTPQGEIVAHSDDCDCGHVNPRQLTYQNAIAPIETYRWELKSNGALLESGNEDELPKLLERLKDEKKDGRYTVFFEVEDVFGNSARAQYDFIIDSNPIQKNQYS